ncbi:TlpA family protein disulfide reductase [Ornithobacterium rhinotracheale]|uniref:TlpA family protein disulfide reductase n=1 Tax=Ornithobacterium rhinotracheale TaxID=28251 RepID=UPI00129C9047|nr:TlpA disulfide reductase family protein [Ornithobacterium rhinotracheale]MRI62637.1 TlpA family protein disulfide reductase [Ornithobacterium rhinotracheale]
MKKALLSAIVIASVIGCKNKPKDYATFSGKVTNINVPTDSVYVFNPEDKYTKSIKLNEDGTFSDTLKVKEGNYMFKIGDEYGRVYLKNGDHLTITTDYPAFDEKLVYDGEGETIELNKFYLDVNKLTANFFENDELLDKKGEDLEKSKGAFLDDITVLFQKYPNVNDSVKNQIKTNVDNNLVMLSDLIAQRERLQQKFVGKPAPQFTLPSIDGKKVSLSDLKGKPVYVDIWATWCGPCKAEIPSLKNLEEKYGDKIHFVSLSVDEPNTKEKWSEFVKEKGLKGIQVMSENGWKNDFVQNLEVQGIPRFVLIDAQGNILNPDAPRPSAPSIEETLNALIK